jgi:hypothetical protein
MHGAIIVVRPQRNQQGMLTLLAGAALLSVLVSWAWSAGQETRALQRLPDDQRISLYQRTIANLKEICDPAPGRSMRGFCREQAELALRFPECDAQCRVLARRHMSLPRP